MIRFACPACHTVVQVADQYGGAKVACNKCGQRILAPVPSPAKMVLASPIPEAVSQARLLDKSGPTPRSFNQINCPACGRKVAMRGKPGGKKAPCPQCGAQLAFSQTGAATTVSIVPTILERKLQPVRKASWPPYLYGSLALLFTFAALPVGLALSSHIVGIVAAALGLLCGLYAVGSSLMRKGVGVGFTSLTGFISVAVLLASVILAGGFIGLGGSGAIPSDKAAEKDAVRATILPDGTPQNSPLVPLVQKLDSGSAAEKGEAADALRKTGADAKPAARALCKAATDPSEEVSSKAFDALEKVQSELVKPLIALVRDNNEWNRIQAAQQIGALGSDGRPAIPALLWSAKTQSQNGQQRDERLIMADLNALAKVGQDDAEAIGCVIQFAQESSAPFYNWNVKNQAITKLGDFSEAKGELRRKVVDCLVGLLRDQAKTSSSPEQQSPFNNAVSDQTLLAAIKAVVKFGPDAKGAAPYLKKLKLSPSIQIRNAAEAALEKIGKED